MSLETSGSFGMSIAILERANLPDAIVFGGLVMDTFAANDPLELQKMLYENK